MSVKDPLDVLKRQFDLPKAQVAHDLTILALGKQITGKEEPDDIYDRYIELLLKFSTTIDDRTRYEDPARNWTEATPPGESEFDNDEPLQ